MEKELTSKISSTILIVGLGNIGKEYENTRHNAGFLAVDELAKQWNAPDWKEQKKFKAFITETTFHNEKIILAKPTTLMNLSGEALTLLTQFYKIDPKNLWVIYDDLDLPLGKIRIRTEGSGGTHNGMKSILSHLPTNTFPRIRIGIESRGEEYPYGVPKLMDTSAFVLSGFTDQEKKVLKVVLERAVQAVELALKDSILTAMNQYNAPV